GRRAGRPPRSPRRLPGLRPLDLGGPPRHGVVPLGALLRSDPPGAGVDRCGRASAGGAAPRRPRPALADAPPALPRRRLPAAPPFSFPGGSPTGRSPAPRRDGERTPAGPRGAPTGAAPAGDTPIVTRLLRGCAPIMTISQLG